jgi:hypothetical protein
MPVQGIVARNPEPGRKGTNSMQKHYRLLALTAVVVMATLFLLHDSEEDRIRKRLEELRALAGINAPESSIEVLVKSRMLGEFFTESTFFDLTNNGQRRYEVSSRQELLQHIARIRTRLDSLELALQDIQVSIEDHTARVRLQGTGLGSMRGENEPFLEIHVIEILLEKPGDSWLITGARHLRNAREPTE